MRVRVAEIGVDHITLVWQSPDVASGGGVDLYQVSFWTDDLHRNITLLYSFFPNVTVRGLHQRSRYSFRVSPQRTFLAPTLYVGPVV